MAGAQKTRPRSAAVQCVRKTDGRRCKHTTTRPGGDCGRHSAPAADDTKTPSSGREAAALAGAEDTFRLAGTLARKGKEPTDHQRRLARALNEAFAGDSWQRTLEVEAQLARHSKLAGGMNRLLMSVHVSRIGGDGMVMPASKWESMGRSVKENATGEMIWIPRNYTVRVGDDDSDEPPEERTGVAFSYGGKDGKGRYFDLTETDGPELAHQEWKRNSIEMSGESPEADAAFLDQMTSAIEKAGLKVTWITEDHKEVGHLNRSSGEIALRPDASDAGKAATIAHELAHYYDPALEHDPDDEKAAERSALEYRMRRDQAEFVAESVAYAVAYRCGVDTSASSAFYLNHWRPERLKQAKNLHKRAQTAMDKIFGLVGDTEETSEELVEAAA